MKTIFLGNDGAGKSTFARKLIKKEPAVRLSLDQEVGGEREGYSLFPNPTQP
jgi:adenylate kinase family enzyme